MFPPGCPMVTLKQVPTPNKKTTIKTITITEVTSVSRNVEKLECFYTFGGDVGDDRGWDGWIASPTRWAWVWVDSGSWWWTGRPGMLRFMGSKRVRCDWATELNWTENGIQQLWKQRVLKKGKERITVWFSNSTSGCISTRMEGRILKKDLYTHVPSRIIPKCQNVKAIQMSTDRWMKEQNAVYTMVYARGYSVSSVAHSCPTLCDLMDYSMPGFPVHHQLPELAQTLVHQVGEAI